MLERTPHLVQRLSHIAAGWRVNSDHADDLAGKIGGDAVTCV